MSNNSNFYSYEPATNSIQCITYANFINTVTELQTKDLDNKIRVNDSLFLPSYHFILEDDTYRRYGAWYAFFRALPTDFGIPINVLKSYAGNGVSFILKLDDDFAIEDGKIVRVSGEDVVEYLTDC